ncbi:MAG: polysaccharide biosynthesis protein, partial [Bacteroidota bacterium]
IAVYGTASTGIITSHILDTGTKGVYKTVAFFEEDQSRAGKQINGIRIYNFQKEFETVISSFGVKELIITGRDLTFDKKNEIVDICLRNDVKIKSIPPVENWVHGELSLNQIREISLEDLLGRESIQFANPILTESIRGKRVCVTGAAGSIGSELCRQIITYEPQVMVLIDQSESALYELELELEPMREGVLVVHLVADITNRERMAAILEEFRPDMLYHAAAYKHVPMMEKNPTEAVETNILGTRILADLAVKFRVGKFVMISTDKAINPTSVMGCTKRIAEIYVQALDRHQREVNGDTEFITTRFGNVLGSNGSVVPIFERQIRSGGPVTVTHPEVTRYFMSIPEACRLVLEAAVMGEGGEIYIFDMGKPVKIVDLATKMIKLSGFEPGRDIEIQFTGLRDGEKLYEELLHHTENSIATHHHKILKARVQEYQWRDISLMIGLFEELISDRNELKMVALMKEIVPEFKSTYSRFASLDGKA